MTEVLDHIEPFEIDPVEWLVVANGVVAEIIGRSEEALDSTGGDLVMSNLAVISDRLSHEQFAELSQETRDQVLTIAHIAHDIAPLTEADLSRLPDEPEEAYQYRTGIRSQIHYLQRLLHSREYDPYDKLVASKLKYAVHGAGLAFGSVLRETRDLPEVSETLGYFRGNTGGALKRARFVQNPEDF